MIDRVSLHLSRPDDADDATARQAEHNEESSSCGELSDADLEQVVGGLSRVWQADAPAPAEAARAPLSVTLLPSIDALHRIPA